MPSSTFCWLPPDIDDTGKPLRPRMSNSSEVFLPIARTMAWVTRPPLARTRSQGSVTFSDAVRPRLRPWPLRSSGTMAMPALIAARGVRGFTFLPSTITSPVSARSAPAMQRTVSVRPAPTRPAKPSTSPASTLKETSWKTPRLLRSRTSSTVRSWLGSGAMCS